MKPLNTFFLAGIALALSASEQEFLENPPYAYNGISIGRTEKTGRTPDGEAAFEVNVRYGSAELAWVSQLRYNVPAEKIRGVERGELEFWAKGPAGRCLRLTLNSEDFAGDETIRYTNAGVFKMTGSWQKIVWPFKITKAVVGHYADMPRYALMNTAAGDKFLLGPVSLKVLSRKERPVQSPEIPAGWRALPASGLYIKPDSALDFRRFADRRPAGSLGRLIVNRHGKLAFEKEPEKEIRFFSVQGFPQMMTKPELSEYAKAVARQGFNMIRLHFLDTYLNNGRGVWVKKGKNSRYELPQRPEDIRFDEISLDRIFYLIAELKKEGVYLNLDLQSSFYGYCNGTAATARPEDAMDAKIQLFVNEKFRNNYAAGVEKLLTTVNPYTGLALRDDPAVAMVCYLNEQDILLGFRNYGKVFHQAYVEFLRKKYGTVDALNQAWKKSFQRFEDVPEFGSLSRRDHSMQTAVMTEFAAFMQIQMDDFYRRTLAKIGWRGLSSNWNMRPYLCSAPARSRFGLLMLNYYHAHPRKQNGEDIVPQNSSVCDGGLAFASPSGARFLDRPFVMSEFGHVYWNRYRHEEGLLWGAGAAFQGWSGLTPHMGNVVPRSAKLKPFQIGVDPIARASNQIAMLAFLRGDVKESPYAVEFSMERDFLFSRHVNTGLSSQYSLLWPLVKIGISYGQNRSPVDPVLRITPTQTGSVGGGLFFTRNEMSEKFDAAESIANELRRKNVVNEKNRTDVSRGRFESCTGELFLTRENGGEMTVTTLRLCGIIQKNNVSRSAGALTLMRCSVPAAVTAASLDSMPLEKSRRILLFIQTDARNSGMKFLDAQESRIKSGQYGTLPVLIRTGEFKIALSRLEPGEKPTCYVLDLTGARVGTIPVVCKEKRCFLQVDTARIPVLPAVCYELVF